MIIMGYPGVGKTTMSKFDYRFIDLDSSVWKDVPNWAKHYCKLAESLSSQGYYVFVSSHDVVRNRLFGSKEKVCLLYPCKELKDIWIETLTKRFEKEHSAKARDAMHRVAQYFDDDIERMDQSPHKKIVIKSFPFDATKTIIDFFDNY